VTNQSTGEVLLDQQLRCDLPADDGLPAGASVARTYTFRLAQGNAGAGNLLIQVTADQNTAASGTVVEANAAGSGETNNGASLALSATLAPYPDLQVVDLAPTPALGWLAGDLVSVGWKTRNLGTGTTSGAWTETLRVRNLTTGQTLFTQSLPYDAAALGDLVAGGQCDHRVDFALPTGVSVYGQIEFTVMTDAGGQIFENNAGNTAESNNVGRTVIVSAPDLVIVGLTSDLATPKTGDLVTLSWIDVNQGNAALDVGWYDRIRVRNQSTGALLVDQQLRCDLPVDGRFPAGASLARSYAFRLAEGNAGVGNLLIEVTADQSTGGIGSIGEANSAGTGEANNSAILHLTSSLATYPDLVPEDLTLVPAADYAPGQAVTAFWKTVNRGGKAAEQAWSECLELVNLTVGGVAASLVVHDDLSTGVLEAAGIRQRTAQFIWPTGAAAAGRFALRVTVDSAASLLEANAGGTAESNNSIELIKHVGSDMQIRNLQVDTPQVQAGGLVSISWEDWNLGGSPASIAFSDRIVVRNQASQVVLDTTLAYDPLASSAGQANGAILPGEFRRRALTFRLPDGLAGSGEISISVTVDQNAAGSGVLYETHSGSDAEANNSASTQATSAVRSYPDLRVDDLGGALDGVGGEPLAVRWTVGNHGQADTAADWNDQVIFSNDALIGNADDVVIATLRHTGGLAAGASYSQTATVKLPMRSMGRYYLGIRSDSGAEVVEPDTRADNVSSARGIDLATAFADLNVLEVSAPTLAQSGEDILITWTVRNDGNATTSLALWNDKLVLSRDSSLSADDIILSGSVTHSGLLSPGQSYTGRATMTLPRDLSGDFHLIVDTSTNRSVFEEGRTGNNS
ncbi:MAG TPA: CARDB domain-containing protein, partial [Accumulibacter sp.]|uniref:CARDB domain-containing protein n=1 Tax=Accumulibacter sp. TaxID=2053492 RepID=UPI002D1A2871